MTIFEAALIIAAATGAGAINAIVGSGTLITFPTLLLLGYPPLTANVSNNIGLVAGGIGSISGYREELRGQGRLLRLLLPASITGALTGASLLLVLPAEAFRAIVPVLIALALVLVLAGPRLQARAAAARAAQAPASTGTAVTPAPTVRRAPVLVAGIFLAGIYGGYFGAAQGVLLLGVMSALLVAPLQQINGIKNVLGTTVNAVAAVLFLLLARDHVDWTLVGLIALGALAGGFIGARIGRRLSPTVLRGVIVVVGCVALINLLA